MLVVSCSWDFCWVLMVERIRMASAEERSSRNVSPRKWRLEERVIGVVSARDVGFDRD